MQTEILARTLWGEARNQGLDGMAGVASVVLNRVKLKAWWGTTIIEVCRKPWQFSCWNANDPNLPKLQIVTLADPFFQDAAMIAEDATLGKLRDRTGGATSYYAPAACPEPKWAKGLTPTVTIRDHVFYMVAP